MDNRNIEESAGAVEATVRPRRRRRLVWCFAFVVVALSLAVLSVPTLLTFPPVREYVLAKATPAEIGLVSIKDLSVGWFTPLRIDGLRVLDTRGMPLFDAVRIESDRSIVDLAGNTSDLGELTITAPTLHMLLRSDGSNLEDIMEAFSGSSDSQSNLAACIKIVDGKVVAIEKATKTTWTVDQFNADVVVAADTNSDWTIKFDGRLDGSEFSAHISTAFGRATHEWPLGPTGTAEVTSDSLPLEPLRYAALRTGQSVEQLSGSFSINSSARWMASEESTVPELRAEGTFRTENLKFASKEILGRDMLELEAIDVESKIRLAGSAVTIEKCELNSDFGSTNLATEIDLNQLSVSMVSALRRQPLDSSGQIDVAALSKVLPHTFHFRDEVDLVSGRVSWSVKSDSNSTSSNRWTGNLNTDDFQVVRSGKPIDWKFPLEVDFTVSDGDEVEIENVTARSDFFSLAGNGKLRSGRIHAQADLEQLVYQLSQVLDLGSVYVTGNMRSYLEWHEADSNHIELDARTKLGDFVMTRNAQVLCKEDELTTLVSAKASVDDQSLSSLDQARLDVISGADFFVAELQDVVSNPSAQANWPVVCRLKGDLQTWLARLKPFGLGLDWQVTGQVDTTTQLTANPQRVAIQTLVANISNLAAATEGVEVVEPVIQLQTAGTIDLTNFACRFPQATLASQSFSLGAHNVSLDTEPHFVASGDVGYQAKIDRLLSYLPSESNQHVSGIAKGTLNLRADEATTEFSLASEIENFRVDEPSPETPLSQEQTPVWHEPQLIVTAKGSYDALQDRLELSLADVVGRALNLSAKGSATQLATNLQVDLAGEYGYDLDGLTAIFGDLLGKDVRLVGTQRQRFTMQGPLLAGSGNAKALVSDQLVAEAGIGWDSAQAYDVALGPAQVEAKLLQGVLQLSPLELSVGEGRARIASTLHVNTEPLWMTVEPGMVVERIRITPEMTSSWMKYVAPLLADATNAEGAFSVSLSQAQIPLTAPTASRVEGDLAIHGGQLGPGPLANQFIGLATQIKQLVGQSQSRIMDPSKTWIHLEPQQIGFQMADGRVYHEGFQMVIDGVPIRTRGSVGVMDESVSVVAEVPVLDEWIDGSPALAGLRGQVIEVPVHGTTSRPRIDQRALAKVSTQLARQAATGYLQNELGEKIQEKLGGKLQKALGGEDQADLGGQLQNEIGRQLNKLFK